MSFNAKKHADVVIKVEGPTGKAASALTPSAAMQVNHMSDSERISAARLRALESSKVRNAHPMYSFNNPPSHYEDFCGPATSPWDVGMLEGLCDVLEVPYPRFTDNYAKSIQKLKEVLDFRIIELGLSAPLVFEWYAVPHPHGQEYWRSDLQTRISWFKE